MRVRSMVCSAHTLSSSVRKNTSSSGPFGALRMKFHAGSATLSGLEATVVASIVPGVAVGCTRIKPYLSATLYHSELPQ